VHTESEKSNNNSFGNFFFRAGRFGKHGVSCTVRRKPRTVVTLVETSVESKRPQNLTRLVKVIDCRNVVLIQVLIKTGCVKTSTAVGHKSGVCAEVRVITECTPYAPVYVVFSHRNKSVIE
jgi:hypothetical protein